MSGPEKLRVDPYSFVVAHGSSHLVLCDGKHHHISVWSDGTVHDEGPCWDVKHHRLELYMPKPTEGKK